MAEKTKNSLFHAAILNKQLDIVQQLLERIPGDCNVVNQFGETPLFLSLKKNCADEVVLALIDHGCDVNIPNDDGETPLHLAVKKETRFIAHKLIQNGADVNAQDNFGCTPLIGAHNKEIVCMLLYYGAYVDERAIILAINTNSPKLPCLLNYVDEHFDFREISISSAVHHGNKKLIFLLLSGGADVNIVYPPYAHSLSETLRHEHLGDVFEAIWHRCDHKLLLTSRWIENSFLEQFIQRCRFPEDQFLRCFTLIFESPYIDDFVRQYKTHKPVFSFICSLLEVRNLQTTRCFSPEDRLKIISLALKHDIDIYFNDISYLHDNYGFDESVELLLSAGSPIHYPIIMHDELLYHKLIVSRMCYDSLDAYFFKPSNVSLYLDYKDIDEYCRFYRADFFYNMNKNIITYRGLKIPRSVLFHDYYIVSEVPSLVQLSRDAIRSYLYDKYCSYKLFKVYQIISGLPVPNTIKNILFLKTQIYEIKTGSAFNKISSAPFASYLYSSSYLDSSDSEYCSGWSSD